MACRKLGVARVPRGLTLRDLAAALPEGTRLIGASNHYFFEADAVALVLENESWPAVEEGRFIPQVELNEPLHVEV